MNTYTIYGNPDVFLTNNFFKFNNYGFSSLSDGRFFVLYGKYGEYFSSENINKNIKEFSDFRNFFIDGIKLKESDIEKHLKILFNIQNNNNYHATTKLRQDDLDVNLLAYPFFLHHKTDEHPSSAFCIYRKSPVTLNQEHTDIISVNNSYLGKYLHKHFSDHNKAKIAFIKYDSLVKKYYDYNKNLSYGLEGELQLIMENNLGEIWNSVGPFLEKNKNISFENFIDKHPIGKILLDNPQYKSLLLHPSLNTEVMKDYLDCKRDEYIDYKTSTSYKNFIKDANNSISNNLSKGASILQKSFTGPFYTINQETKKPFTGINQILSRQHLKDKNFSNPVFSKLTNHNKFYPVGREGKQLGIALSVFNDKKGINEENFYFSHEQLRTDKEDSVFKKTVRPKAVKDATSPFPYESKDANDIFETNIKNFIYHSFHDSTYNPAAISKEHTKEIAKQVKEGKIDITHVVNTAIKQIFPEKNISQKKENNNTKKRLKGRG